MNHVNNFLSKCLVLDTETTSPKEDAAEIIEFGFAIHIDKSWEYFGQLIHVDTEIDPEISSIISIVNSMLEGMPKFDEYLSVVQDLVDNYKNGYLIAHNSDYDRNVLQRNNVDFGEGKWICTYRLARRLFSSDTSIKNHKLQYLRHRFQLPMDVAIPAHRAGNDCFITGLLLDYLVDYMINNNLVIQDDTIGDQVYNYCWKPILVERMPFGKHKGVLLDEIPMSYWQWALNNMDVLNEENAAYDADLAASVAASIEKRL